MLNTIKSFNRINKLIKKTPLEYNDRLSKKLNNNIFLKREDLQLTRSFKIRGSLNKMLLLKDLKCKKEFVCASAGNHAQGFAYSCNLLNVKGNIFIPTTTPLQKIERIKHYGKENIELKIIGNNFPKCLQQSLEFSKENNFIDIHPYDDLDIIDGQSTICKEIIDGLNSKVDIISSCVGGGGLISGLVNYRNNLNLNIKIIGGEPENAHSLHLALQNNKPTEIKELDTFVDGASVSIIGNNNFNILKNNLSQDDIFIISNGKICNELLHMYGEDGIILEPAGVLSVCAMEQYIKLNNIKNQNIVCILSGGNNDISRYPEIIEKNKIYLGKKKYYIIKFLQKPKQLKKFILNVLGSKDDITRFEYIKKTNKNYGNVLLGIESENFIEFEENLIKNNFEFQKIEPNDLIYSYLI